MKKIVKIESLEKEVVYDITIKDNHNYYANRTLIHNCDFRGNSAVLLWNTDSVSYAVKKGDRIAQLVLSEVPQISWVSVASKNELSSTDRGANGFGSTGK